MQMIYQNNYHNVLDLIFGATKLEKRIEKLEMAVSELISSEQRSLEIQGSLRTSMQDIAKSLHSFNDHMVESKILNAAHLKFEENTLLKLDEYNERREKDLNKVYNIIRTEQAKVTEIATTNKLIIERNNRFRSDIEDLQAQAADNIKLWKKSAISLIIAVTSGAFLWLLKGQSPT